MGIFSSKKVITVSASTMSLVAVSPKPFTDAVLEAVLKEENIHSALLKTMTSGVAAMMPRIYNYARDTYTLGLPEGKALDYGRININTIDAILLAEMGDTPPLRATGAIHLNITPVIAVYNHLINTRKYNRVTNEISVYPPNFVWRKYETFNVETANKKMKVWKGLLAADGVSINIMYELFLEKWVVIGQDEYYEPIYELQYVKEPYTYTENVPLPEAPLITWGEDYLVAFYREYDVTGLIPIGPEIPWLYRISSQIYPELNPENQPATGQDYFPVIPFRYNNQDLTSAAYEETDLYKTSKELSRIGKIGLSTIAEKLNANPGVADVDHAYIIYGLNLQTVVPESLTYLHKFFENLYDLQYSNELEYLSKIGTPLYGTAPINTYQAAAPNATGVLTEYGLQLFLDYDYIKSLTYTGSLGTGRKGEIIRQVIEYDETISLGYEYSEYSGETTEILQTNRKAALILSLQAATNVIHKIEVYGLEMRNLIYRGRAEHTSMLDVARNPDENNLVIPLQYQLAQSFPIKLRNALYADSMLLVLNSYQVTKLKWYQSSWFKVILIIIAVVLIIISLIAMQPQIAAAIAKGAMAIFTLVAVSLLISISISLAANFIVKEYGDKIGIIGAVILAVAAIVLTQGRGTKEAMQFMMTVATYTLQAATALISSANEFLIEEGQDIINEYATFTEHYEDASAELKKAEDLLKMRADINPLLFARPERLKIVPSETPTAFYSRCLELPAHTIHLIHDDIPKFFTSRLALPRNISEDLYA